MATRARLQRAREGSEVYDASPGCDAGPLGSRPGDAKASGTPYGQLLVPAVPDAVRLSRRLVRDLCELVGLSDVAEVAELLAGEITANVVLHTRTPCLQIMAKVTDGTLRVCVSDDDPELPEVHRPSETQPRGRGLLLVELLSKDWGAAHRPGGKIVWFTLETRQAGTPSLNRS